MSKGDDFLEFQMALTDALMTFQYIEEGLKMYIERAYWIILKKVGNAIPIRLSRDDIETKPLNRLLDHFAKYNSNDSLVAELRGLTKERNYCAHQAFLLTVSETEDADYMRKHIDKIKEIKVMANRGLQRLFKEAHQIEETVKSLGQLPGASATPTAAPGSEQPEAE